MCSAEKHVLVPLMEMWDELRRSYLNNKQHGTTGINKARVFSSKIQSYVHYFSPLDTVLDTIWNFYFIDISTVFVYKV